MNYDMIIEELRKNNVPTIGEDEASKMKSAESKKVN